MSRVKKYFIAVPIVLLGLASTGPYVPKLLAKDKPKPPVGRLLTGKVLDKKDNPVVNAVVYLVDSHTHEVKTYIVSEDGAYHFPELSTNVDYEIYAQFQGVKSPTRTVSQFDDRPQINIILRIGGK